MLDPLIQFFKGLPSLLMQLWNGYLVTLSIFFLTLLFSLPLALPVALGRMSKHKWVRKPVEWFLLVIRGTPLMLQLIFVYFAPYYLFGLPLAGYRFPATIIAFTLNYAAYLRRSTGAVWKAFRRDNTRPPMSSATVNRKPFSASYSPRYANGFFRPCPMK